MLLQTILLLIILPLQLTPRSQNPHSSVKAQLGKGKLNPEMVILKLFRYQLLDRSNEIYTHRHTEFSACFSLFNIFGSST